MRTGLSHAWIIALQQGGRTEKRLKNMKICEMPQDERPRERMLSKGARSLGNAELLAVILRTGTAKMNAVEMAMNVLASVNGSLNELMDSDLAKLCRIPGIGQGKGLQICAISELARRMAEESARRDSAAVRTVEDAYKNLLPLYSSASSEECWCLFLKHNRRIADSLQVSKGGEISTVINIKAIVGKALDIGAKYVIRSHNHPSGDPHPSLADIKSTEQLHEALGTMEISLLDHLVIGSGNYFSFSENRVIGKHEAAEGET